MGTNQTSPNASQHFLKQFQNNFHFYKELNDRIFGYIQVYRNNIPLRDLEEWEYSFIARSGKSSFTDEEINKKLFSAKKCMKLKHKNILKVFSVTESSQELLCGDMNKLNIYFEYYFHNLEVEIRERAKKKIYFSEDELKALLITMVNGMVYLGANEIFQSNYIPSRVYLRPDGEIKIGTFFPWAENTLTVQQMKREFFAPEIMNRIRHPKQFDQYNTGNDEKSLLFSMGITIMEAASLKPLHLCFDFKNGIINFQFLWDLLNQLSSRYSRNLIKILAMTIAQEKEVRPTATQIMQAMSEYEVQKIQIQPLQVSQIIPNLTLSNLKYSSMFSHQGLNLSHVSEMQPPTSQFVQYIKSPAMFSPLGVKQAQPLNQFSCTKKSIVVNRQTRHQFMTPQKQIVLKKNLVNSSMRFQQSPIQSPIKQPIIQQPIHSIIQQPVVQNLIIQQPIQQLIQTPIQQQIQQPTQYRHQPIEAPKLVTYNYSPINIIKINQTSQLKNAREVLKMPNNIQNKKEEKQIEELVSELTQKKKIEEEEITEATQKQNGEIDLKQEEFEEKYKQEEKQKIEQEEEKHDDKERSDQEKEKSDQEKEKSDQEKEKYEEEENKSKNLEKSQQSDQELEIKKEKSEKEIENIIEKQKSVEKNIEDNKQEIDENTKEQQQIEQNEEEKLSNQDNQSDLEKIDDQQLFEKMSSEEFENEEEEEDEYDKINKKILMAIQLSENTIQKLRNIEQQDKEKAEKSCEKKESLTELFRKYEDEKINEPQPRLPEEAEKGVSFTAIDYDPQDHSDKFKKQEIKKRDIVSCVDLPKPQTMNEDLVYGIVAFGKFDKEVCLLSKEDDKIFGKLKVHVEGLTSVKFSPVDSVFLFTAARKDDLVYQWDLRKYDKFLNYFERRCATNQRMTFDLSSDGKEILLGNEDGSLIAYNIANKTPTKFLKAHSQCCNTVKFYDYNESVSQYCLSSGGERTFLSEDSDMEEQSKQNEDQDSLKFWKLANL